MTAANATTIELDAETTERLRRLAEDRRSAPRALMKEAIEQYVDREERRQALHAEVGEVWDEYRKTGRHLTGEEADGWLELLAAGEDVDPPSRHD